MDCFVRALETAIKHRPGILIGAVPIGESTDRQIVFEVTCMRKIENDVALDDFFTAVCRLECVEQFLRGTRGTVSTVGCNLFTSI